MDQTYVILRKQWRELKDNYYPGCKLNYLINLLITSLSKRYYILANNMKILKIAKLINLKN